MEPFPLRTIGNPGDGTIQDKTCHEQRRDDQPSATESLTLSLSDAAQPTRESESSQNLSLSEQVCERGDESSGLKGGGRNDGSEDIEEERLETKTNEDDGGREAESPHNISFPQISRSDSKTSNLKSGNSRMGFSGHLGSHTQASREMKTTPLQQDGAHDQASRKETTSFGCGRHNVSFSQQMGRSGGKTSNTKSENSLTDERPAVMQPLEHAERDTIESQEHSQSSRTQPAPLAGDVAAHLELSHHNRLSQQEGRMMAKVATVTSGATRPGAFSIQPQHRPGDDVVIPEHHSSISSSRNQNQILIQGHLVEERPTATGVVSTRSVTPLVTPPIHSSADDTAASALNGVATTIELVEARRISDDGDTEVGGRRAPRYLIRFVVVVILLGTIGLAVGLVVREKDKTPVVGPATNTGSAANETRPGEFSIDTFIQFEIPEYSRQGILADKRSPQSLAIEFLSSDPQLSSYPSIRRLTRFALATLYYALNNFVLPEPTQWDNFTGWVTNTTECNWYTTRENRSACAPGGQFVSLTVEENFLTGKLPREITLLKDLEEIQLARNNIFGTIPSMMESLELLSVLDLSDNILSGTIPAVLGSSRQLVYLNLQNNFLRGSIPSTLFNYSSVNVQHVEVRRRYLAQNADDAPPRLEVVKLGLNFLTGTIPSSIGTAHHLRVLDLRYNDIYGTIPTSLSKLNLSYFGTCGFCFSIRPCLCDPRNVADVRSSLSGFKTFATIKSQVILIRFSRQCSSHPRYST
jgi:hypothetical protein